MATRPGPRPIGQLSKSLGVMADPFETMMAPEETMISNPATSGHKAGTMFSSHRLVFQLIRT